MSTDPQITAKFDHIYYIIAQIKLLAFVQRQNSNLWASLFANIHWTFNFNPVDMRTFKDKSQAIDSGLYDIYT